MNVLTGFSTVPLSRIRGSLYCASGAVSANAVTLTLGAELKREGLMTREHLVSFEGGDDP